MLAHPLLSNPDGVAKGDAFYVMYMPAGHAPPLKVLLEWLADYPYALPVAVAGKAQ